MSAAENTRYWLGLIHDHRLRIEGALENACTKIQDSDWSEGSLPIEFLRADIAKLRQLANMLDAKLGALITCRGGKHELGGDMLATSQE
jgi:hypothetical protein